MKKEDTPEDLEPLSQELTTKIREILQCGSTDKAGFEGSMAFEATEWTFNDFLSNGIYPQASSWPADSVDNPE